MSVCVQEHLFIYVSYTVCRVQCTGQQEVRPLNHWHISMIIITYILGHKLRVINHIQELHMLSKQRECLK
jgi:hypothetical protein